ncbi:MAG: mitochondrial fission ELM1 family protein [Bdellovibrionales bacterium]|jgi:hypothetical protein
MENQCLGLAVALGLSPAVKRIKLRSPWKQLSPYLRCGLGYAVSDEGDSITPPWPDILIASGRASVPASLYVREMSRKNEEKGTFTVQIQNPVIDSTHFDLVVVPRHDQLKGENVISTIGSLHRVTLEMLSSEAAKFYPQVAHLPSPRVAVSIGGSNAVYRLTPREMKDISEKLKSLAGREGSLMVTTSRRTGAENLAILRKALLNTQSYIWDGHGANPYYGMLGLADAILVTCDSVNMLSEACSTGKPVMVIDLPGGSDKFRRFHQTMRNEGLSRPFTGHIEKWNYTPLDETHLVAARVKEMMGQ